MPEHELTLAHIKQLIKQFTGQANIIAVPRIFISLTGDHIGAILLNQIIFWSNKTDDPDGWFYKTTEDWEEEIGISYAQLKRAITELRPFGLETDVRKVGSTPKAHYRLNEELFFPYLLSKLESEDSRSSTKSKVEKVESSLSRKSKVLDIEESRKSYKGTVDYTVDNNTVESARTKKRSNGSNNLCDEDYLKTLQVSPAYVGIDINLEFAKMVEWCRANNRTVNRRCMVNWLNRINSSTSSNGNKAKIPETGLGRAYK